MKKGLSILISLMLIFMWSSAYAKEKQQQSSKVNIPKTVLDISKENTYPNPAHDEPELQPSKLAKSLLDTTKMDIENPTLIRMLNESAINTTKFAFGYHAKIFLGKWPLNYDSEKTTVNWEFKQVNENRVDNRGSANQQKLNYMQERQATVKGGLTAKVPNQREVQKLMQREASKKTELPISFSTVVGYGTKLDRIYHVEPKKVGHLYAYTPAVNEKGKVTYGEVYLVLDGSKKRLEVKNVTQQGIGAWIPIQDHLSFKFLSTN